MNDRTLEVLKLVTDDPLHSVTYGVPRGDVWPHGHQVTDRFHETDMSLRLTMRSGAMITVAWEMQGLCEGLAITYATSGDKETGESAPPGETHVPVTEVAPWERFQGHSIKNIATAWHVPNEATPSVPWAYRLDFSKSLSIVLAMGEATDTGFTYSPDSLLVFFDKDIAAAYRIPTGDTSALASPDRDS